MTIQHSNKRKTLRFHEYYDIQDTLDELYKQSKEGKSFSNLYELIISRENILTAYRKLKNNKGSITPGVNKLNMNYFKKMSDEDIVRYVRKRLSNYQPQKVKRVLIPKNNGTLRPLGIPTIQDRLIQQCIKQILEPICEAKFYDYSYGFRPLRSTKHAIARCYHLMQQNECNYVVDIDIKGFFDNVNHGKLLKQIWSLGIKDKTLISIISKLLKCEVENEGIQSKGTPQGGILSPLLSNIVLNELDWWIHSQWMGFQPNHTYATLPSKYRGLRSSKLKEIFIVRYADDFKIFCKSRKHAVNIFNAVKSWLKERLDLEISEEKSKIVNLKKDYSEFLGFKLKLVRKGFKKKEGVKNLRKMEKFSVYSRVSDKAKNKMKISIRKNIKDIQRSSPTELMKNIGIYNSTIMGFHNYYNLATHAVKDFHEVEFLTMHCFKTRLRDKITDTGSTSKVINEKYGKSKRMKYISKTGLVPVGYVQTSPPYNFKNEMTWYTPEGRELIHKNLDSNITRKILWLMNNPVLHETNEYNDNRLSLFSAQKGKCYITNDDLEVNEIHCHHKKARKDGGADEYMNLVIISESVHKLIHATHEMTIYKYVKLLSLSSKQIDKINRLRKLLNLNPI